MLGGRKALLYGHRTVEVRSRIDHSERLVARGFLNVSVGG